MKFFLLEQGKTRGEKKKREWGHKKKDKLRAIMKINHNIWEHLDDLYGNRDTNSMETNYLTFNFDFT
jgi:hypothetical protein